MRPYLRIKDSNFEFKYAEMDELLDSDIPIALDDFELFFNEQSKGKQLKIRAYPELSLGFMGYFEEFVPKPLPNNPNVTISELMDVIVDLTERLNEKGLL